MMSASTPTSAPFFFFFILSIATIKLSNCIQSNRTIFFCPEIEKQSLLTLKQSLEDPYNLLSSWDGEVDCCKWEGVVCNSSTGHVHQLHLQGSTYPEYDDYGSGLSGKINPCFLNLKHLTYLDLSGNNFAGETIPSFFGSFTNLEYLDLSFGGFEGKIPHNIGNLSNLRTLILEGNWLYHGFVMLNVDSLEWLSGLSKLEYLNMNRANLSRATNWANVINSLPSLLELHCSDCSLDLTSPLNDVNLTSLTVIDLSNNRDFDKPFPVIPSWFFQLNNLLSLDLSQNSFIGPLPTVSNATKLQHIDLGINYLNSSIPGWLYYCKDLKFLDLYLNYLLHGKISNAIGNLTSLEILDLSDNELSGELPREITNLCRIQSLILSSNKLQGEVLDSFGNLSSLQGLWLHENKFTGNLPESLGQLSNLQVLYIENNKLEGIVTENHFTNVSELIVFAASGNHLTLNVDPNWFPPIQLKDLGLGSWCLGSQIPSWLQTRKKIHRLDLSNTGISGTIPSWFLDINFLNVSHNNLHGEIPHMINISSSSAWDYDYQYLYMSSNKFSGSLPRIGVSVVNLDLSRNLFSKGIFDLLCDKTNKYHELKLLNLEGNQLSGELPDCFCKWGSLTVLKLGNNTMSGSIPNSIGFLAGLESLSLYGNKFSGQIPFSMHNCTSLLKIDLSHNNLDGNLPTWIGTSLVHLNILILRSNRLSGDISSEICQLQYLQILDLSNNQFSGIIPRCVSNFTGMASTRYLSLEYNNVVEQHFKNSIGFMESLIESASVVTKGVELEYSTILSLVTNFDLSMNNLSGEIPKELTRLVELGSLNLSGNHLTGSIPQSIGDMKQMESLDFSRNSLSGQIPNGFTLLPSLSHLNLSFNKLTGRIPESTQLQSFDASSFIGNDLCGPPSTSNCSRAGDDPQEEENGDDEKAEIEWLYVFISSGFAVGFSGVCSLLVLNKSWRDAYFELLKCMWDKIYVYLCVKWGRLTKPAAPTPPS